jgi:hypothetical protein
MANLYVSYNGLVMGPLDDPSGLCGGGSCAIPTPYVTRSDKWIYLGEKSHRVTDISIEGKVYAKDSDISADTEFSTIDSRRVAIQNAFDDDFLTLTAGNYTFNYVKVNDVNFSVGNVGILEFTISLTSYDEWFKNDGITEVKNEYNYSQAGDGIITCRHSMSAQCRHYGGDWGSNSSSGADGTVNESDPIWRAKYVCEQFAGYDPTNATHGSTSLSTSAAGLAAKFSANDADGIARKPFSTSHTVNRAEGTYSIEETYKQGSHSSAGYVENYEISEKRGIEDDLSTIDINYSIKGPPGKSMSTMRGHIPSVTSFYNKINNTNNFGLVYDDVSNKGTMDSTPITYEVNEEQDGSSIGVSLSFNQLYIPGGLISYTVNVGDYSTTATNYYYHAGTSGYAYLDYDISISTDEIKEETTVGIKATMKSKGNLATRKTRINAWASSLPGDGGMGFLYALACREYLAQASGAVKLINNSDKWNLNPATTEYSIGTNDKTGEITMSASFNNKDMYFVKNSDIQAHAPAAFGIHLGGDNLHWRTFSFDISQKTAINLMSLKAGMNSNPFFHDYMIFDHNTLTKESSTISVKGGEMWQASPNIIPEFAKISNIGLSLITKEITNSLLLPTIDGNDTWRGLESWDSSREGRSLYGINGLPGGELVNIGNTSKNFVISQTVGQPFVTQDA